MRAFFAAHAPDIDIVELDASTATVEMAAKGHGVMPAQIAKTLSLRIKERTLLIVTAGDARLNNRKIKDVLGGKPRMLGQDEVVALTGHPVGGVCPFGLATPLPVYCDVSLKEFDEVVPAAGSTNSALRISPERMAALVNAEWVDVLRSGLTRVSPSPPSAPPAGRWPAAGFATGRRSRGTVPASCRSSPRPANP